MRKRGTIRANKMIIDYMMAIPTEAARTMIMMRTVLILLALDMVRVIFYGGEMAVVRMMIMAWGED